MMTPYPRYKAPALDPHKTFLQNQLLARGRVWHTPFGDGVAHWEFLPDVPAFDPACSVELALGSEMWTLYLNDASCLLRHVAFGHDPDFDLDNLPVEIRTAVFFSLLAPAVAAFQQAAKQSLTVKNIEFSPSAFAQEKALGMKIHLAGCEHASDQVMLGALVPQRPEAASSAAGLLRSLPLMPNPSLADAVASLPLEAAFETGYLYLSPDEIASLQADDMLLPEVWSLAEGRLNLRIDRSASSVLVGTCVFDSRQAVLEGPLAEEVVSAMESNEQKDLEIRLSFELDRRVITLGELSAITPGFTFPVNSDSDSVVTVRAQGKAFARGRLVDMNGILGVQLTEIL